MILYLHGFRSSPESYKARVLGDALRARGLSHAWCCPQLPASPAAALALCLDLARRACDMVPGNAVSAPAASASGKSNRGLTVIGSSLGGFYATWLAQRLGCRALVLNPVVHAARALATQVGSHRTFHDDQPFEFLPGYVDELARAESDMVVLTDPQRYFLMAATGDEVLDWRDMRDRYAGARQHIIEGSDHGISDFADYMDEVLDFALAPAPAGEGFHEYAASGPERPEWLCAQLRPGPAGRVDVHVGSWDGLAREASAVRREVFIEEQQVSEEEEMDGMDAGCLHAVAYDEAGQAIGTGRLLPDGHIGRMAVRRAWRGCGVGSLLLQALIGRARHRGDAQVILAAQVQAQPFYRRHGFVAEGEVFLDANMPHVLMRRTP